VRTSFTEIKLNKENEMKNKNKIYGASIALAIICLLITVFVSAQQSAIPQNDFSRLTFRVNTEKPAYILGEAVNLQIEVVNETSETINFPQCALRPEFGSMKILIAQENGSFKEYRGPGWGVKDKWCGDSPIAPGQSLRNQVTVLWNPKIPTSHLNEEAAKRATEGKITTDYAIPKAGAYLVKAVFGYLGNNRPKLESAPTQIAVNEPMGEDFEVWNKIKNNGELAYFLQQGTFLTSKDEERKSLLTTLEEIAQKFPNSLHGKRVQQKLVEYRQKEAELQELKRKYELK